MEKEYYEIVKEILEHKEFLKRKNYKHHGEITVYDHCLKVSHIAYKISKKFKSFDSNSVAIGGLLHDFYFKPWKELEKRPLLEKHGFVHAKEAVVNSYRYFPELMNGKIENIILRHMFPLNKIPPKYIEAWIIVLVDKYVSFEVLKEKHGLIEFFGFRKKEEKAWKTQ